MTFRNSILFTHFDENQNFSLHTLNVTFSTVLYQEISLFYLQKQLVLHYSLDDFLFEMDSIQLMLMLEMVSVMVAWESKTCLKWISVSVNHPKIWFWILLSGCFTFPCKLITRICCYIKTTTLPDKFCVFSSSVCWKSMNISGRSCMLIISVSYRINGSKSWIPKEIIESIHVLLTSDFSLFLLMVDC